MVELNGHEFEETPGDSGGQRGWRAEVHVQRVGHDLATERQ